RRHGRAKPTEGHIGREYKHATVTDRTSRQYTIASVPLTFISESQSMTIRRRRRTGLQIGHDAFLDIVANLVGILIILVVILGTQSQQALEQADSQPKREIATDDQLSALAQHAMRAASAQADANRFEAMIADYDAKLEAKRTQRGMILDLIAQAEHAWKQMKSQLDQADVQRAERLTEKRRLEAQLVSTRGQKERLEDREAPTVEVDHLPTPMAKTVFGDEVHFRLKDNLLSVVPVESLDKLLVRELKRSFGGNSDQYRTDAIGPVGGYICRYEFEKTRGLRQRGGTVTMARQIRVARIVYEPLREPIGQPLEKILSGGSLLDIELAGRNPATTTVTIWVYPNSFATFRRLKEHLYRKGFPTAARPMAMDQPIAASPNGNRSSAQ
ncbi:MAG: hypothetical protein AAF989_13065, partial [Planctomycetota bacterium]